MGKKARSIAVSVGVTLSVVVADALGAQRLAPPTIPLGARVRITTSGTATPTAIGALASADSARLVIVTEWDKPSVVLDWAAVSSIDVRRVRSPGTAFARGARSGAIVSGSIAAVGIVATIVHDLRTDNCDGDDCSMPASFIAIPAGFVFTAGGAVIGGLLGRRNLVDWERVWPGPSR